MQRHILKSQNKTINYVQIYKRYYINTFTVVSEKIQISDLLPLNTHLFTKEY